jgi:hypothetical protein
MSIDLKHTGFAIALAWPQTYCKQPGAWYDGFANILRISKNRYYKAGHAALVLVDIKEEKCHYFDFGRYHTPFSFGRVRSANTDYDLEIKTKPIFSEDKKKILNYSEILNELQHNESCHGDGDLYASYCIIDFDKSFTKAMYLQESSPIKYGPFIKGGNNCSRFVYQSILPGVLAKRDYFKLKYLIPTTPTPMSNVRSFKNRLCIPDINGDSCNYLPEYKGKDFINRVLPQPERPTSLSERAQWLSGEGAGSWYMINKRDNDIIMRRFSPSGDFECEEFFENTLGIDLDIDNYKVTYLTNCSRVTLIVAGKLQVFNRIEKN